MNSTDKIHIFFIALALLFWNPLSFYLLYSGEPVYAYTAIHALYWLVFGLAVAAIFLMTKQALTEKARNFLFAGAMGGILFSILVAVNGLAGLFMDPGQSDPLSMLDNKDGGLLFEPNSSAHYETVEFDYVAEINNLGLRDNEIQIDKGDRYRILCIGDSWTFGWGVGLEYSWPKKLEEYLHQAGYTNIEVINAGRGGQCTANYRETAGRAVPMLKPDLVLVGVLQLDDLAQLYEINPPGGNAPSENFGATGKVQVLAAAKSYLKATLGNLASLVKGADREKVNVKAVWKESADYLIGNFNHLQNIRFQSLEDSVQQLFRSGDLNVGLLSYYIDFPDRVLLFNNPAHPATQYAVNQMKADIKAIKETCEQYGASPVFVNLPMNHFVGHKVVRTPSDILNPYFEETNAIDSIYASIAASNDIPCMELTAHFKSLADKEAYFFRYDGHPNEKGYAEIGNFVGAQLIGRSLLQPATDQ
ncbi:MAG: hypothetical protein EP344_08025 [Bacteroidetes bacterium]|nr:MAG: hypothetical protein EP344_08025 [Bacteroidota bacterium]